MKSKPNTPGRRGRPSAEELHQKMATVLDVAKRQFAQHGYRAVTMRGVAEMACVSTRTLYNWYSDKLALFEACLNAPLKGAEYPQIDRSLPPEDVLRSYVVELVSFLSRDTSLGLGLVVYREGAEFPEMAEVAYNNQNTWLVAPLAEYLREHGLEDTSTGEQAKLFIAMALSEFQRRLAFGRALQTDEEIKDHAGRVVALFLKGTAAVVSKSR